MANGFDISRLDELDPSTRTRVEAALSETLQRELQRASTARVRPSPDRSDFQQVLKRLSSDPDYRQRAVGDPNLITSDYKLSLKELQALRQVAVLSGADVSVVDRVRSSEISRGAVAQLESVDVSCCSCCCCCCGDTAVSLRG